MAKVRILSDRVANQIAAGEVIERPAAVVKELVENALDAGATRIEVEFRHGGRSLMRVEDNGSGMSRDDALLALERHATSKISEAADLDRLGSYGFRGEALPSIASVSRFELQTREAGQNVGTEVLVSGGKLVHVRDCGRPVGTRIEVAQLFNSVPARRKFLKSDQTEAAHIVQCVRLYALACPGTAFSLIEDGRVIFRSPECPTLAERIAEIFGRQTAESLVPIESVESGMRLGGLIGRPGVGRGTRHEMIVFVNQRPVDSRTLNYALIESYYESVPKGRYPLAFVFFECDPAAVDVNVHPAKREVRFRNEPAVRSFVIRSVLQRLREIADHRSDFAQPSADNMPKPESPGAPAAHGRKDDAPAAHAEGRAATPLAAGNLIVTARFGAESTPYLEKSGAIAGARPAGVLPPAVPRIPAAPMPVNAGAAAVPAPLKPASPSWRFVGLAHGNYALFETTAGLILLDRRAAHERVWFERLQEQFRSGAVPSQRLLLPVPVELDPIAAALLLDRVQFLNAHGFEIAEFGRNFFRIEAVPAWMEPADAEPFLRDLLGAFREGHWPDRDANLAREELARLASVKAVRLPAVTGEQELRALVTHLFATRTPMTNPAGRPTYIELNHAELARRFQK
ncbi:DNA mismatch repair endonuclease MutL [Opitutus terrae]|uniref:DNA mismatch repair protein MutL n=1 Tax=Opitutus terrae (strain DSM 11246 / JCM 15787 / PB90-1) TaxID=452637 RepID=MUTL_OPITP|nr:DNA mismatch repair endonuclease MutL [Opitutus terrae]B1ZZY2.1 RecName: Full=DNA mismatch repair protein MutL [Opitutus terrae PB90-1]ACB77318.1 DNA mismatch repair protein MutL [Opitutus terrae PB90-1]